MLISGAFTLIGVAVAGWGVRTAVRSGRPANLGGALAAAVGLLVAFLGATALVVPGFLF